ncbi:MAG: TIGR01777 family oxidoreductase [Polyangiaceae bacterium]|nr:TIGR01777 family oxidoreductase [Polyangiaceae bacterium]
MMWGEGVYMKALIAGGTGLLGRELLTNLQDSVVLSRDPVRASQTRGVGRAVCWDPAFEPAPRDALQGIDVVFNLAGEPVAEGRWTEDKKRRIRDSRVMGTRNLVAGLRALDRKPAVLVSASAVGYYGDRGDEELDETSQAGSGFLAEVCTEWEGEALAAEAIGVRVVCVRIGIVLAPGGGALARMLKPFKMGAGGRLGSGRQWMPWIHIDDVVGVLLHAGRTGAVRGAINAVSPQPVTNAEFTRALGHAVHRPAFFPVPKTALRIAFGEMSGVLMASQRVLPRVADSTGYEFKHAGLEGALAAVMAAPHRTAA